MTAARSAPGHPRVGRIGRMAAGPRRRYLALVAAAIVLVAAPGSGGSTRPPRVLIIQAETTAMRAVVLIDRGIRDVLARLPTEPIVYTEYLDSQRFPDLAHDAQLLQWWARKYRDASPDLIVSVSSLGLRALRSPGQTLWTGVPIVFCAVSEQENATLTRPPNTTGVTYKFAIKETAALIDRLVPGVRRIVTPFGPSQFDAGYREEIRAGLKDVSRPAYEEWNDLSLDQMRDRLRTAPADAAVMVLVLNGDDAHPSLSPGDIIGTLAEASSRPVFAFSRQLVGNGIVGGLMFDPYAVGVRAGDLSVRVLLGESADTIDVTSVGPPEPVFDARVLRRFSIPLSALPPHSVVLFDEVSVFQRYRWQIASTAGALTLQATLIGVLLEAAAQTGEGRSRAEAAGG